MKIGLLDIDGHNFPNLALMKLSAYHKQNKDNVSWYDPFSFYDIVYKSKVFTFTDDYQYYINSDQVKSGGTGYDITTTLFCDNIQPDYSLYGIKNLSYGFLTRGCIRKCDWCVVPKKEGGLTPYMDIEEIAGNNKKVILMDNNILASDYGLQQIEKIVNLGLRVDFNQGLDARIIAKNPDIAELLSRVKWLEPLRMACDNDSMIGHVVKATELLRYYGCKPSAYFVYVLLTDLESSYNRINICKSLGVDPFAQPFRTFEKNQIIPQWQKDMAHYVNKKSVFKSIDFKEFKPRKNFFCKSYFVTKI